MTDSTPTSLDWITRLIGIDTTSRGSNLALIDVVESEMQALGLQPTRLPNAEGTKANLLVTLPAADGRTDGGIVVSGHTDVVPVDGQDWDSAPFEPQVREGRLYGRGAADMKSFLGVAMTWLPRFVRTPLSEPLHLAFSYDEEVGCLGAGDLAGALTATGQVPRVCVVGEPTSMRVIAAHKSINLIELTFHGKAAHSSLTPQGVNAIEYAAEAVTFIRGIADELREQGPFDEAYDVPHTTASVNVVHGGIAGNTVADTCTVQFEFRTIGADDPVQLLTRIEEHARGLERRMRQEAPDEAAVRVDINRIALVPGLESDRSGTAARLVEQLGGLPSGDKVTYGTEAGLFHRAGIDTVVCGPGDIAQAHAANEFIELSQITACEQFMDALLEHLRTPA